ncbi:polysaccharide biosynthesis protein [Kaistia terrae]|uniref:Polysaccharide biosynthesis protein n=1 Tax=Kaistia terrae TaxID=537017 RepID=A0ABW0Q0S8_9HYPH|nr:nucleoside-diphosphate sugar epimerase/dehydratase [Kaistia terrae]MCX5576727.1 nucleoside-diphosphate sugar epimerase/dehydratase [Kaistia terrae]
MRPLDFLHERARGLSRPQKQLIIAAMDLVLIGVSLWAASAVRLGGVWPDEVWGEGWPLLVVLPPIGVALFHGLGLYRFVLRSLGRHDVIRIAQASFMLSLILAAFGFFDFGLFLPRSTPIIFGLLLAFLMVIGRGAARSYYQLLRERGFQKRPVIVYGAGESGLQLVAALHAGREFRPVAYLDDDKDLQGRFIAGRRVHAPGDVDALSKRFAATDVFLALPSISRARRKEIVSFLSQRPVRVQTIPSMVELAAGFENIDRLREVGVQELLNRDAVDPVSALFSSVRGKSVMVTGAGGSIGSELCRQILAMQPLRIVLFEMSEAALYSTEIELRELAAEVDVELVATLGSVCDEARLHQIVLGYDVETIYHAAAYKHVPLVEANPLEGIRNNILGTRAVARIAAICGVDRVILVSTDKAVRPTSVMGATKRLAEMVLQHAQAQTAETIYCMVRFGNVMGSSGSVIPLFQKQIAAGGPVTVTHPEVIRYFMTIPEAAQLVVQAGSLGKGGDVFLLDMGTPVAILDLAKRMIHLSGLEVKDAETPQGDIEIAFTGLRPGEKLFEELLVSGDVLSTSHPKIMRSMDGPTDFHDLDAALIELENAVRDHDIQGALRVLQRTVEGFESEYIPPELPTQLIGIMLSDTQAA